MEKPLDLWLRKGKATGEVKPTETQPEGGGGMNNSPTANALRYWHSPPDKNNPRDIALIERVIAKSKHIVQSV